MLFKYVFLLAMRTTALTTQKSEHRSVINTRETDTHCTGGRFYYGWFDETKGVLPQCKCPSGQFWDAGKGECVMQPLPKPRVLPGQKPICASGPEEYENYDTSADICRGDGRNVALVVPKTSSETQVKHAIIEECKRPKCPSGQVWNQKPGKAGKCKYPSLPKAEADKCKKTGGKPICAKNPKKHCKYDENEETCEDNGENCLKCLGLDLDDSVEKILDGVFAGVEDALDSLGLDCIVTGLGCIINDGIWDDLGGLGGLGEVVCNLVGSLLGLC